MIISQIRLIICILTIGKISSICIRQMKEGWQLFIKSMMQKGEWRLFSICHTWEKCVILLFYVMHEYMWFLKKKVDWIIIFLGIYNESCSHIIKDLDLAHATLKK